MFWKKKPIVPPPVLPKLLTLTYDTQSDPLRKSERSVADDHYLPSDRDHQTQIIQLVRSWCISNQFLVLANSGDRYITVLKKEQTAVFDLGTTLYSFNFKGLVNEVYLDQFIASIKDTKADRRVSRCQDLYVTLRTFVDPDYLERFVNRFYSAMTDVTLSDDEEQLSWDYISRVLPLVWVLFLIQSELRAWAVV